MIMSDWLMVLVFLHRAGGHLRLLAFFLLERFGTTENSRYICMQENYAAE